MKLLNKMIALLAIVTSTMVYSQDTKNDSVAKINYLKEVEVTATSNSNKSILSQPQSISKLDKKELNRNTGLFLDDAINTNAPGVNMQKRTVSGGQQFNIRGYGNGVRGTNGSNSNFDTQGTKVYLNNIPVTDAEGITVLDDIDFASIGNVEIVKGPSGSLYGLAIAGVVNLKTIQPELEKISLTQNTLFGSYGLKRVTTQAQIGGKNGSMLINYGNQTYDGFMKHTASSKDFVNIFGNTSLSEKQKINAYLGYSDSYDQRNGELTREQYEDFDYSGNPAYIKNDAHSHVVSFRGGLNHDYQFNKSIENTLTVFGTGIVSDASSAGGWTDRTALNYGFRTSFNTNFDLGTSLKLSGITGAELQQQNSQTIAYAMVANGVDPDAYNVIGSQRSNRYSISKTNHLFTEWTLNMPYDFSVTAGVGSSYMGIESQDRMYVPANNTPGTYRPSTLSASYKNMVSPKFAINKVFNKAVSVYASYNKGYKAPVSSYFYIPYTGEVNKDLKAEVGTQFEIGSKGNLLNNRFTYEVALFQTNFKDKMTSVAVPNATNTATLYSYIVNAGEQVHKGIEINLKYELIKSETGFVKNVTPFANVTYSDFKYKDYVFQRTYNIAFDFSGEKVLGTPPVVFNSGFDFMFKYGFYGNVTYNYRDAVFYSYVPTATTDPNRVHYETKSYNLLNAKLGYQRKIVNNLSLDASLGINNITNTQYYQMVFNNQLPDAYLPAPYNATFFGGLNLKYTF